MTYAFHPLTREQASTTDCTRQPSTMPTVQFHHVGPSTNGVTLFGRRLEQAVNDVVGDGSRTPTATGIVHLQFTDRIWGSDVRRAAATFIRDTADLRQQTVVTLHDVPDPHGPPARYARRAEAYGAIARAVDQVVVSSHHEADLLARLDRRCRPIVIPPPVPNWVPGPAARTTRAADDERTVGIAGWIFPGKGHRAVIDAVAACNHSQPALRVVAMGQTSPGHDELTAELTRTARRRRVHFSVTGWLSDAQQVAHLRRVGHPVVAHERPSASGSTLAWIGAGRRPLVRRNPFAEELSRRAPGSVTLYDAADLPELLGQPADRGAAPAEVHRELTADVAAQRHIVLYRSMA